MKTVKTAKLMNTNCERYENCENSEHCERFGNCENRETCKNCENCVRLRFRVQGLGYMV